MWIKTIFSFQIVSKQYNKDCHNDKGGRGHNEKTNER